MLFPSSVRLPLVLLSFVNLVHYLLQCNYLYYTTIFNELLCFLGIKPPLLPHVYKFKYFLSSGNYEVGGPLFIRTSDKTSSFHGPTLASSPPLFSTCSFDHSNANHIEDVPMSLSGSSFSVENDQPIKSKVGIKKKNLDVIKKFQEKWATKLPWAKLFIGKMEPSTLSNIGFVLK